MEVNQEIPNIEKDALIKRSKKTYKFLVVLVFLFVVFLFLRAILTLLFALIPFKGFGDFLWVLFFLPAAPVAPISILGTTIGLTPLLIMDALFLGTSSVEAFKIQKRLRKFGILNRPLQIISWISVLLVTLVVIILIASTINTNMNTKGEEYWAHHVGVGVIDSRGIDKFKNDCEKAGSIFFTENETSEVIKDNIFYCNNTNKNSQGVRVFNTDGFSRLCSENHGTVKEDQGEDKYDSSGNLYTFDDLLNCDTSHYNYSVWKRDLKK